MLSFQDDYFFIGCKHISCATWHVGDSISDFLEPPEPILYPKVILLNETCVWLAFGFDEESNYESE